MSEDVGNLPYLTDDGVGAFENLEGYLFMGFPGLSLVQEWVQKYSSFYTRAILLIFGAAIFLSQQVKGYLGSIIRENMMCCAEIREGDDVYWMVLSWISQQNFSKSARNFEARIEKDRKSMLDTYNYNVSSRDRNDWEEAKPESLRYYPSSGMYPFWHKRTLFFYERAVSVMRDESLSISCFGRNPQSLKNLLEECREAFKKKDEGKTIMYHPHIRYEEASWVRGMARSKRHIDTVVLDAETKTSVMKDLENYFDPKQRLWYTTHGIPYRRGYLLHGPPGTGKSSLSIAIAGHFNLKIYIVNLNASKMDEEILTELFRLLPSKCVVLMEDIDAAGLTERNPRENRYGRPPLSLSGLLNVIDGVASQEGRVLIMTTNHIEKLDAALVRPGRVDKTVEFSNAGKAQLIQIFEAMYTNSDVDEIDEDVTSPLAAAEKGDTEKSSPKKADSEKMSLLATKFAANIPNETISPAEIQGYLLGCKDDPENAVAKAAAWAVKTMTAKDAAAAARKKEEEAADMKKARIKSKALQKMLLDTEAVKKSMRAKVDLEKGGEKSLDTGGEAASKGSEDSVEIPGVELAIMAEEMFASSGSEESDDGSSTD